MNENNDIVNIAAYRFVDLAEQVLPELRTTLKEKAEACEIKGTILLSTEGINICLAGLPKDINLFKDFLNGYSAFKDIQYKVNFSSYKPFTRMLVRLKKEIISMGRAEVEPNKHTAPYISAEEFKKWYEEDKEMVVLDTRNDYEVELGTFENAIDLNIKDFRSFPQAIDNLSDDIKEKPVVTFCTGGVRCEKAAELMLQNGFKEVYQLHGGILDYFKACGGEHWNGECFVFDKRVALDSNLNETKTRQCYACRTPLPITTKLENDTCSHCHKKIDGSEN